MWGLIFIIVVLLCAAEVISLFRTRKISTTQESAFSPYTKRSSVLNKSEAAFFIELQKQLPPSFYVFPKMRIIDFLDPNSREYSWRNKIWAKHVDFLICNQYFKPMIAIEINGNSHRRQDRMDRDELVRQIFSDAQLPLEFVDVGTNFAQSASKVCSFLPTTK